MSNKCNFARPARGRGHGLGRRLDRDRARNDTDHGVSSPSGMSSSTLMRRLISSLDRYSFPPRCSFCGQGSNRAHSSALSAETQSPAFPASLRNSELTVLVGAVARHSGLLWKGSFLFVAFGSANDSCLLQTLA